ncbi:hypothetical protein vseg_014173 [Gypsophila vaccaria]
MAETQIKKRVTATMTNKSQYKIYCERLISWPQLPGPFPPTIPADGVVEYNGFGYKGAVLYNGPEISVGRYQTAFLLAWDAPGISPGGAPNKVYVTCGTKTTINSLSEAEILARLEESTSESNAMDPITKTYAEASIKGLSSIEEIVGAVTSTFGSTNS